MKKTDITILGIMLLGAVILAFLPNKRYKYHQIKPEELIYKLGGENHYFTTDDIAKAIIDKDPSFFLVDVRNQDEYLKYTLTGALNIPYDSLLNDNFVGLFDQDAYKIVLFSNGSSLADQAWLTLTRMGYENLYVMKGGLNEWIETIIKPQKPEDYAKPEEWDKYEFRKGASRFFGGGSVSDESNEDQPAPAPVIPVQQNKSESVGGCE